MAAYTGTGDLISSVVQVNGLGKQPVAGSGALSFSIPSVNGTGVKGIHGSGDLLISIPSISSTTQRGYFANGALIAPRAILAAITSVPDPTIWETDNQPWGEADFVYGANKPIMLFGNEFLQADSGLRFGELPLRVVLMRSGLTIMGRDRFGNWKSDPRSTKEATMLWPIIRGTPGDIINVYLGAQDTTEEAIRWEGPFAYVIGTTVHCDFTVSGRYLAVRFESEDIEPWELLSYDLDLEIIGERG